MGAAEDYNWVRFMNEVDTILDELSDGNFSSDDLPDFDYRGCFEAGINSRSTAAAAIENAGGF